MAKSAIKEEYISIEQIDKLPVKSQIARAKYIPEENLEEFGKIKDKIKEQINSLISKESGKDDEL